MTDISPPPSVLCMPTWGIDWLMYQRMCLYLGLTPSPALFGKVGRYLLQVAATQSQPKGFCRWLAEARPARWAVGFIDVWTRILMPTHPWRYRFNAVMAIHECDGRGIDEIMKWRGGRGRAWISILLISLAFTLNLILGMIWFTGQVCAYAFARNRFLREQAYFNQKIVLVTGANRGLGLALSGRLLSLGANVVAVVRDSSLLHQQVKTSGLSGRVHVVMADVSVRGSIQNALSSAGLRAEQIDSAIINAGIKEERARHQDVASVERVFGVNVFGAMQTVDALLHEWRTRGNGHFIFISSMGRWHGMARTGSYNASKAALSLLAESMAIDFKVDGTPISVTTVEPGLIRTGMIQSGVLQRSLSVCADTAARKILQCASTRRGVCRFPLAFALLTAMIAALPIKLRIRLLGRLRSNNGSASAASE